MADRIRRALAAIVLPLLFVAMSGLASAATLTVTNTNDPASPVAGDGSLRGEILAASTGDTINFSVSGTITLGSTLPSIAISLTIDGSGKSITVDGDSKFQIFVVNSGATLNLRFLTLAHGSQSGLIVEGGGIYNNGTLTVANSTLSGNEAIADGIGGHSFGGAIFNDNGAKLTVTDSTFSTNRATVTAPGGAGNGGAISNNFGTVTITNSTFSANHATGLGGAIVNGGTVTITSTTFSANQATGSSGGAIYNTGTVNLKGSILADSTPNNCNTTITASYSIADDSTCFTNGTNNNVVVSTGAVGLDPAGLAMNGGPTKTIALEPDSEAVDFIPVASCTDQSSQPLMNDQRGFPRPDPGNPNFCDAGAYELTTMPFAIEPKSERLQIARSTNPDSDQINTALTFIENGFPICDAGTDAFNGFSVLLQAGTCAEQVSLAFFSFSLHPWVVRTVNHESYGTLFSEFPPGTLSARMVELPTPAPPACGEWTLNLEIAGIDSTPLGDGPFSLILINGDGGQQCFDITNAIVGGQIPTPGHGVRRVRRR
jgi:predicted outer membrane repeat protein